MELKLDHAQLKQENESKQQEISQLRDELERTRSERDQLQSTNIELVRSLHEPRLLSIAGSRVPSQPSALPHSIIERNEESMNLELENLLPHHINLSVDLLNILVPTCTLHRFIFCMNSFKY
jgi:hypothetical protein